MMDEGLLKIHAKIVAMESLLTTIAAVTYANLGYTPEVVEELNAAIMTIRDKDTFPGAGPEMSDLLASEIADATKEMQDQVLDKLKTIASSRGL